MQAAIINPKSYAASASLSVSFRNNSALSIFFSIKKLSKVDGNDDFVKRIHEKVEEVNRDTEVTEIMTIEEEMNIRWHYGYDEGEAAGLEKGAAQKQREIAKNLKDLGVGTAKIIKATGLSAEEVEEL